MARDDEAYLDIDDHIDPDVQRNVSSLITALGGGGANEEGRYELGDEALACLRDLKKWLRLFDDKNNRLDVARCIAEHNLVSGDLLQILAQWPENETNNRIKSRIALACVELLTPLTWVLPKEGEDLDKSQWKHVHFLALAQTEYKRQIINFDGARILHTATRVALPSIAVPLKERSNRDNNIIRMLLYLLRNIAMIEPPRGGENEGDEAEISRSALIDAFQYQDVLYLLLALCSGDFGHQDVVILEVLFHLIKGIDIDTLFMTEKEKGDHQVSELAALRSKEAGMHRSYQRTAPSRHGRFGTMVQVSRGDGKVSTLSGQDALLDGAKVLAKMDAYKKPKPKHLIKYNKNETPGMSFDKAVRLAPRAQKSMKEFVADFLDSGFNPLFLSLRKAIDHEAERVEDIHTRQFFYLVAWFLQAERARRAAEKQQKGKNATPEDSFGIVAAVLDQPMLITLNHTMQEDISYHRYQDLKADMRCFSQILLTVQDMYDSPLEEDVEIAENILQRIFHEETTHDRVVHVLSNYHNREGDKDFGFLDACTELAHVFLRLLENFSKNNKDLYIRSRKRKRRRQKAKIAESNNDPAVDIGGDFADEEDDTRSHVLESKERKFSFETMAKKYVTQNCVDTFVKLLSYYNELKPEQLKRCHRYFHRVAFKMDWSVLLFRLDIIALFNKLIKGPGGLDSGAKMFREWNDLVVHILRLMTKKLKERPELFVEMLFSKTSDTSKFLKDGHEKTTVATQTPVVDREVKKSVPEELWIATVVSAMLDRTEAHLLEWFKVQLEKAITERTSWEEANQALQSIEAAAPFVDDGESGPPPAEKLVSPAPEKASESAQAPSIVLRYDDSPLVKTAILKNAFLRLLMRLCGLKQIGDEYEIDGSIWVIPSKLTAQKMKDDLAEIRKAEFDPLTGDSFGNGQGPEWHVRVPGSMPKKKEWDDDDSEGLDWDEELFPMGGPTDIHKKDALALLRKKNRGIRVGEVRELTEEQQEERRRNKERRDRDKQRKVKSELFVRDSDDDSDEERDREFFEKEEKLRKAKDEGAFVARMVDESSTKKAKKTRKPMAREDEDDLLSELSDLEEGLADEQASARSSLEPAPQLSLSKKKPRKRTPKRKVVEPQTDDEDLDIQMDDRNSSPAPRRMSTKRAKLSSSPTPSASPEAVAKLPDVDVKMVDLDESEDELPVARPRKRVVSGFVLDSSDEE